MISYHIAVLSIVSLCASTMSPLISLKDSMDHVHRHAYVHPEKFRRSIPLQMLLNQKPQLFVDKAGYDHMEALQDEIGLPDRSTTVTNFLSHNAPDVILALESAVRFTNDICLIAAMVNPLKYVTREMMQPIATLIEHYRSIRASRALLRYLPDAFHTGSLYDSFFEELEYTAFEPAATSGILGALRSPAARLGNTEDRLLTYIADNRGYKIIQDIGSSKAVKLRPPFGDAVIIPSLRAVFAVNDDTGELLVWRKASHATYAAPSFKWSVSLSLDRLHAFVKFECQHADTQTVRFPLDETLPFLPELEPTVVFPDVQRPLTPVKCQDGLVLFKESENASRMRCLISVVELDTQAGYKALPQSIARLSRARSVTDYQKTLVAMQRALVTSPGCKGIVEAWTIYAESGLCRMINNRIEQSKARRQRYAWLYEKSSDDIAMQWLTSATQQMKL